jgi:glycosyltransferase involved in cell wall biosynthesis
MKIALALEYPLMQQGGTEVLVQELVRGLSRHYEIVLVSGDAQIRDLPREFTEIVRQHFTWNRLTASAAAAGALAKALRGQNIALAHFHLGGTYEWRTNRFWQSPISHLAKLGVPCLSTNHLAVEWLNCGCNPARPAWQKVFYQAFALLSRSLVYKRLKLEVCVSKHDRARVVRMFPMFEGKIIQRYHSLLPADAPPPNLAVRDPVVLCIGTIGGRKAQPNLAEAFARVARRHPQWHLDLVGRTEVAADEESIRACAARHGLSDRVHLHGRLSDEETAGRMKRASVIAMPSRQEGLGLSLQEALFHGCVGVGTRVGGIPELIEDDVNGLLVAPNDIVGLSGALERLMSEPGLLERYREQCRPSILRKGMTSGAMVESYLELYQKILRRERLKFNHE